MRIESSARVLLQCHPHSDRKESRLFIIRHRRLLDAKAGKKYDLQKRAFATLPDRFVVTPIDYPGITARTYALISN